MLFLGWASLKSVGQACSMEIQVRADVAILYLKIGISMLQPGGSISFSGKLSLCS